MKKYYVMLLSSLIACSSRAMLYDGMSAEQDVAPCPAVLSDTMRAVERNIKNNVRALAKDDLTEDRVLAVINNALEPYASNPAVADTLQNRCKWIHKIASWHHEIKPEESMRKLGSLDMPYRVRRFDINEDKSRIALLFDRGGPVEAEEIHVYEETGRGKEWKTICIEQPATTAEKVAYMRFIDKGKKLVYFRSMEYPPVTIVTHDVIDIDGGQSSASGALQKEIEEKISLFKSNQRDKDWLYMDQKNTWKWVNSGGMVEITDIGFRVHYEPTLREIASFLVRKRLETLGSMDQSQDLEPKWVNYWAEDSSPGKVCRQIYHDIQKLEEAGELTPKKLLPKIQAQFPEGMDSSNEKFEDFCFLFRDMTRVKLPSAPLVNIAVSDDGNWVATIAKGQGLCVWKEENPHWLWRRIPIDVCRPMWAQWIRNGAQLLVLTKGGYSHAFAIKDGWPMRVKADKNDVKSVKDKLPKDLELPRDVKDDFFIEKGGIRRNFKLEQSSESESATITIEHRPDIDQIARHLCAQNQTT